MHSGKKSTEFSLMRKLFIFGLLVLTIDETFAAGCPVSTVSTTSVQECITGIVYVKSTKNSVDEICRMYEETLYCARRGLLHEGLDCNIQDIARSSLTAYYNVLGPKNFNYSQCNLEPEVTNICSSEERLGLYTLTTCAPYLDQMHLVGDPQGACAYSTALVECAEQSIGTLHVTCSKTDIESAFKSQTATTYLTKHAPGLDLGLCFKLVNVHEDKNCVDYATVFTATNATSCLPGLQNVNITDGMDPRDRNMQCSFVQDIQACMVKKIRPVGSNCTMKQVKSVLNVYAHLADGMGDLHITQCPDDDSYISMPMCEDEFRMVSFFYVYARPMFDSLLKYNNKNLVCTIVKSSADLFLKNSGIHCTTSQVDSALSSLFRNSFVRELYPQLDLSYCFNIGGSQSNGTQSDEAVRLTERDETQSDVDGAQSGVTGARYGWDSMADTHSDLAGSHTEDIVAQEVRKKRNAVAVKDWLWKDNKIPYVIDESDFSTTGVLMIINAIKQFNDDISCIKFTPRINEFDYVRFKSGQGCHSTIGRDGGEQTLTIGPDCYYHGVILHEMTHAVGFFHEQNRWDRDQYISILWNNIQPGKEHDFNIQDQRYLDTLGAPYDYGSIMHYGPYIFSKDDKQPTMIPKYDPHVEMGQRNGFSKLDIWKINTLYGCKSGAPPLPDWMAYLSSTWIPTTQRTTPTTPTKTVPTSELVPGIPGKPKVLVTVFPNALRINWNQPPSTDQINGYLITYKLEPNGRRQQVRVAANKLAYYLSTYTSHPGRRYTITIAAITDKGVGPESEPVTTRSACSQNVYLDNDTYDKIHSPFFKHGYYEQDVVCQWVIRTPERQHINLTFTNLDIPGNSDCGGDYVRIGTTRLYCNSQQTHDIIMATNHVTVTFVSKPSPAEIKHGGFSMIASSQGYSPINLNIDELITGFNISWEPPLQTPSAVSAYVISYKLASDVSAKEIVTSPLSHYFLLSTYPHFGREFSVQVYARYPTGDSEPAGPMVIRSRCSRNITVTGTGAHLNSPHYPNKYEPGTICEWNVSPTSGHSLVLDFEHVDLNKGDYVDILSEGTYLRLDDNNKGTRQITTKSAKVQFVSDDNDEAQGFRINFSLATL